MNEQQLEEACDEIDRRSEELYRSHRRKKDGSLTYESTQTYEDIEVAAWHSNGQVSWYWFLTRL